MGIKALLKNCKNMKPKIYILQYGQLEQLKNPTLNNAIGLHVLTGLIVYKKDNKDKGIIIDPGLINDFNNYKTQLSDYNLNLSDITHILCTHFHQDHIQSLAKFSEGTHIFHYGTSSLLGSHEYQGKEYENYIEIPEISFKLFDSAHTKKDTIYIIDSSNEGKVAFMGDMIFADINTIDIETQRNLDKGASVNPKRRLNLAKKFFEENNDIQGFYLGHGSEKVSRENIKEYFKKF